MRDGALRLVGTDDIGQRAADISRYTEGAIGALQPYLSAINTTFRDHLKEPVALGPLVNQAISGWKLAQVDVRTADIRVPLPADVALQDKVVDHLKLNNNGKFKCKEKARKAEVAKRSFLASMEGDEIRRASKQARAGEA
eukprot:jgi/Tetstr1/425485/TSEL_015932.t1